MLSFYLVKIQNDVIVVHFHATDVWNLIVKVVAAVDGRITGRRSNFHDRHSAGTVVHPPDDRVVISLYRYSNIERI